MVNYLQKLEDNNIGSYDTEVGGGVESYLEGEFAKKDLRRLLTD